MPNPAAVSLHDLAQIMSVIWTIFYGNPAVFSQSA